LEDTKILEHIERFILDQMTRFVIYARVSTTLEEQDTSYKTQVDDLKEAIIRKYDDFECVGVYSDRRSGTKAERPEFQRMLADAKEHKFDIIVAKDLSRIARNTRLFLNFLDELKKCDVSLILDTEGIDTRNALNDFYLTVLSAIAQMEAANTRARIQESYAIKRGMKQPARPSAICLGYKIVKDDETKESHVERDEEEAALVKRIFRMFVEEKMSTGAIATQLSIEGIETKRTITNKRKSGSKGWYRSGIRYILQNPKYIGEAVEHDKSDKTNIKELRFKGAFPPIIDTATYRKAQKMLEKLAKTDERAEQRRRVINFRPKIYPLSGICFCSECNSRCSRYSTHNEYHRGYALEDNCKGNPVWGCLNGRFGKKHPDYCGNYRISEFYLYSMVIEALTYILTTSRCLQEYLADVSNMQTDIIDYEKAIAVFEADMKAFNKERENIITLFRKGLYDEKRLDAEINQLDKRIEKRIDTKPEPPEVDRSVLLEDLGIIAKTEWSEKSTADVRSWLFKIFKEDTTLKRNIVIALVESIEIGGEPRFRATIKIRGYDKRIVLQVPRRSPYRRKKRAEGLKLPDGSVPLIPTFHYDTPEIVGVID